MSGEHPPDCACHEELPTALTMDFEDGEHAFILDTRGLRCALAEMARKAEQAQKRLHGGDWDGMMGELGHRQDDGRETT